MDDLKKENQKQKLIITEMGQKIQTAEKRIDLAENRLSATERKIDLVENRLRAKERSGFWSLANARIE